MYILGGELLRIKVLIFIEIGLGVRHRGATLYRKVEISNFLDPRTHTCTDWLEISHSQADPIKCLSVMPNFT